MCGDGSAFVNMLHAALNTTDCICNEAMKFSTTSNVAIYAANTFDGRQAWNIQPWSCYGDPDSLRRSSGSLLFAGVCMQLDVHDAPLSDKMDGLYGPHTFTPLTARGRARTTRYCIQVMEKIREVEVKMSPYGLRSFSSTSWVAWMVGSVNLSMSLDSW